MRLGQTPGFPLGRHLSYGPESIGVNVPSVQIHPAVVEPHAILHAPYLLEADRHLRWTSYTLAQRWRPESAHTGRNYVIGRYLAQRVAPVAPSSLLATMMQEPLIGLTRGHPIHPMALMAVQPAEDWGPRFDVADFLLSGIPVTVRMDAHGPDLASFVRMADSVFQALPTCLQPWFSWAWNARSGEIRGNTRPLSGTLCFVASDQPLVASSAVAERRDDGVWVVHPPTDRRDAPNRAWSAWVARLQTPVCDIVPRIEFGLVDIFGQVGPARKPSPHQERYLTLLHGPAKRGEETRVDFAHLRLGEVYAEVGRQALRAWKLRDLADALEQPGRPFDLEWVTTEGDHDQVLSLVDRSWALLDGLLTQDSSWQRASLVFDLQWEHARRARVSRQEGVWRDRCTAVMQNPTGVGLMFAIDYLQTNVMSFERATTALHVWADIRPPLLRDVLTAGRERSHGLISRIHAALDVAAEPWGQGEPGAGEKAIRQVYAGAHTTDFQYWMAAGASGGVFRLIALYAHVAPQDVQKVLGKWLLPGTPAHKIFTTLPDPSTLEVLSTGERRALARICAAWLLDDVGVRNLGWGGTGPVDEGRVHDWAWRVLEASRGLGFDMFEELSGGDWFKLVLGEGAVTGREAHRALTMNVWKSWRLFPPGAKADWDKRISHALLAVWPLLQAPAAKDARLHRYVLHWPRNGMAQLLAASSGVESTGDLQAPTPPYTVDELRRMVGQADVAPYAGAVWSLMESVQGTDAAPLRAIVQGNLPVDPISLDTIKLLRSCFEASDPNDERCQSLRAQLKAPVADIKAAVLLSVVAALPPEVIEDMHPALLSRLFDDVRSRRYRPDEALRRAMKTHRWLHTLLFHASFMSLDGAEAKDVWKSAIRGTPAALCFADVLPQDLPVNNEKYWLSLFPNEGVVEMLRRFAQVMELKAPDLVRNATEQLAQHIPNKDLFAYFGEGPHVDGPKSSPGDPSYGSSQQDTLKWVRRYWYDLDKNGVVKFGSFSSIYRFQILVAAYTIGSVLLMWRFFVGANRVVATLNASSHNKAQILVYDIRQWSIFDFTFTQDWGWMLIIAIAMSLCYYIVPPYPEEYVLMRNENHRQTPRSQHRHQIEVSDEMFQLLVILRRIRARK